MTDRRAKLRSCLRPQFSLRLLLLAFTAFALGFPIWYRWPYEETLSDPSGVSRITTWQRQWGGSRVKHGPERWIVADEVLGSTNYRHGLRHGPYESEDVHGQHVNDLKDGLWIEPFRTSTWRMGKLDGPMEIKVLGLAPILGPNPTVPRVIRPDEYRTIKLVFADGRLTHLDGKELKTTGTSAAASRLFALLDTDLLDDRTHAELGKNTQVDFVEQPLRDVFLFLSELHGLPMMVDPKLGPDSDFPITAQYQGIDLASALLLLTAPNNFGCDYRYGTLWVSTADDCEAWHDPTGIEKIKPSPGSALARAWNEPIGIDFYYPPPLKPALDAIEQKMAISIDTSRLPETLPHQPYLPPPPPRGTYTLNHTVHGRPLHHVLGHLLYIWHCRCELDGETLIILPEAAK